MLHYICTACGKKMPVTTREPKCACGGVFELDFTPEKYDASQIDAHTWSLFRYRKFMAGEGDAWKDVTMGEGMSPVVEVEPGMFVKVDYMMPTLSFKDRGAAALVAHMKAIGVKKCVQDSSGNAGRRGLLCPRRD